MYTRVLNKLYIAKCRFDICASFNKPLTLCGQHPFAISTGIITVRKRSCEKAMLLHQQNNSFTPTIMWSNFRHFYNWTIDPHPSTVPSEWNNLGEFSNHGLVSTRVHLIVVEIFKGKIVTCEGDCRKRGRDQYLYLLISF